MNAIHTTTGKDGKKHIIQFLGPFTLGPDDIRVLHAAAAIGLSQKRASIGTQLTAVTNDTTLSRALELHSEVPPHNPLRVTTYRTSLCELAEVAGYSSDNTKVLRHIFSAIQRLHGVTIWDYRLAPDNAPPHTGRVIDIMTPEGKSTIRVEEAVSYKLVHGTRLDGRGGIELTWNPRETLAILGRANNYTMIDLEEVRNIRLGPTILIHARLCGFIDPGATRMVGDTLIEEYLYDNVLPTTDTSPNAIAERNKRRIYIKRALSELAGLGWKITRGTPKNPNCYVITRPATGQLPFARDGDGPDEPASDPAP